MRNNIWDYTDQELLLELSRRLNIKHAAEIINMPVMHLYLAYDNNLNREVTIGRMYKNEQPQHWCRLERDNEYEWIDNPIVVTNEEFDKRYDLIKKW